MYVACHNFNAKILSYITVCIINLYTCKFENKWLYCNSKYRQDILDYQLRCMINMFGEDVQYGLITAAIINFKIGKLICRVTGFRMTSSHNFQCVC